MILLVAHQKGGVGKSTLALNLAVELQRLGLGVILVEADPTIHTVSNFARDRELFGHKPIPAIQETGKIQTLLFELAKAHEFVIVDAPGKDSVEMRSALTVADVLLMPTGTTQADLDATASVADVLTWARKEHNPDLQALAVINRAETNIFSSDVKDARDYLSDFPELDQARTVIHERKAYKNAPAQGLGVVEMKDSKAKAEVQLLVQEILKWR